MCKSVSSSSVHGTDMSLHWRLDEQTVLVTAVIVVVSLSQRELAAMCGLPQSSVARIESCKTTPNLGTLLNIFQHLGLTLTVSPVNPTV